MDNPGYGEDPAGEKQSGEKPPPYSGPSGAFPSAPPKNVCVQPIGPDDLPPPYTPSYPGASLSINCKVCQNIVSIVGKEHQRVIKCPVCNEASPIKPPAPGKKYVRCPCNGLLICRAPATKVACPRQNCKRILTLGLQGTITSAVVRPANTNRVQCAYCADTFLFAVTTTCLVRCSTCRRISTVDPSWTRTRCIVYVILGLVFLGAGVGVTVGTYEMARSAGGIYTVWIGAFIIGVVFLIRAAYLGTIRTSKIVGPAG